MFSGKINKLRANPAAVNDIRGTENAFKNLLCAFSERAIEGYYNEIRVKKNLNGTITIESDGDVGVVNFDKLDTGIECVTCDAILNNILVAEFMGIAVGETNTENFKYICFENGTVSMSGEEEGYCSGTRINVKYDNKIFSDVDISASFLENCLDEAALLNPGVRYALLFEEIEEEAYNCQVFCYDNIAEYVEKISDKKAICDEIEITKNLTYADKEETFYSENYSAKMRVALNWTAEKNAINTVYLNKTKIDSEKLINAFFKMLKEEILRYEDLFHSVENSFSPAFEKVFIPIRKLKEHVNLIIDIKTNKNITYLEHELFCDALRESMILELFVSDNIGRIEGWYHSPASWKGEYNCGVYSVKTENSILDYANDDDRSAFIEWLTNVSCSEENFSFLINSMHSDACKKEPMFYYIIFTRFNRYITPKKFEMLKNYYIDNVGYYLPDFFKLDN